MVKVRLIFLHSLELCTLSYTHCANFYKKGWIWNRFNLLFLYPKRKSVCRKFHHCAFPLIVFVCYCMNCNFLLWLSGILIDRFRLATGFFLQPIFWHLAVFLVVRFVFLTFCLLAIMCVSKNQHIPSQFVSKSFPTKWIVGHKKWE